MTTSLLVALLRWLTFSLLLLLGSTNADFSFDGSRGTSSVISKPHHIDDMNFHKVLEQVGKTVLRPGGTSGTNTLLKWSDLTPNSQLLELGAGWGNTGMLFAERIGCHVMITDVDEHRMSTAKNHIQQKGLSDLVQTKVVDMFDIESSSILLGKDNGPFDCAILEGSLTHYSLEKKEEFFQSIAKHTDQLLLHEICFQDDVDETTQEDVKRDMRKTLRIGWFPETVATWKGMLEDAGFEIKETHVGEMAALNPLSMVNDEGIWGAANIARNIATNPKLRARMLESRAAVARNHSHIGFVLLKATKRSVSS